MIEDVVVGLEDPVRQPVVADELPEVLDRVQLGRFGWQGHDGDVGRHGEFPAHVPAGLIEQQHGMRAGRDRKSVV